MDWVWWIGAVFAAGNAALFLFLLAANHDLQGWRKDLQQRKDNNDATG